MRHQLTILLALAALSFASLNCSGDSDDSSASNGGTDGGGGSGSTGAGGSGGDGAGGSGAGGAGGGGGDIGSTGGTGGTLPTKGLDCQGDTCACSNGLDDDGDGLADIEDPECSGPYDNDEATFWTGIPGDNRGSTAATECFFDGNSGPGNDDRCQDWTPNGCDCFGCCDIDLNGNGTAETVGMFTEGCRTSRVSALPGEEGGTCRAEGDAAGRCDAGLTCLPDGDGVTEFCTFCGSCTQDEECVNDCLEGEDCIGGGGGAGGGTGGAGGGTEPICPEGRAACETHADCAGASEFCVTGCCQIFG